MRSILSLLIAVSTYSVFGQSLESSYPKMADQIIRSLKPGTNETVIIRFDQGTLPGLPAVLEQKMKGKVNSITVLPYGPAENFKELLSNTDIYIWLPVRKSVTNPASQVNALVEWLDAGRGRQIHFHWGDGTRNWDSTNGTHNQVYDKINLAALDIDYKALDTQQEKANEILRSGTVTVTSPSGTNLNFVIGNRTITKQNGDASAQRMKSAKVRIEREIELPAGAIRVSPLEETVNGVLVIGTGTIAGIQVESLKLTFEKGVVTKVQADKGKTAFEAKMKELPGLNYFREIGIGFNPKLIKPDNYDHVPYYGYGDGVVRLSLGNNIEVGGKVEQEGVQWMFFLDTTVKVGNSIIVKDGSIQDL